MTWTNPRTWVASEVVTAALLNLHVRDNAKALGDSWTPYTPVWTGSGTNPAIGNGTITGFQRIASAAASYKTIDFRIVITMGSTTTYGTGNWIVTSPASAAEGRNNIMGNAFDSSASANYPIFTLAAVSTSNLNLRTLPSTAGNALVTITPTVPFTWADGDVLTISGSYESA